MLNCTWQLNSNWTLIVCLCNSPYLFVTALTCWVPRQGRPPNGDREYHLSAANIVVVSTGIAAEYCYLSEGEKAWTWWRARWLSGAVLSQHFVRTEILPHSSLETRNYLVIRWTLVRLPRQLFPLPILSNHTVGKVDGKGHQHWYVVDRVGESLWSRTQQGFLANGQPVLLDHGSCGATWESCGQFWQWMYDQTGMDENVALPKPMQVVPS